MNILEIIVILLTVIFAVTGYFKGFVRKLASLLSLVVSVALVSVCLPYVTNFLKNSTPVYDMIVKQCRVVAENQIAGVLDSGSGTGAVPDEYQNMSDEEIKSLMGQEDYGSFAQTELIGQLPLPQIFREQLLSNNTEEGYLKLGVSTFQDYIVHFCATVILNVVSFVVAFVLVQLVLRMVIAALDILSQAPVLSTVNRVAGLLLGLLQMLFLLWIFFMVVSAASATETGLHLMSMIQESELLAYLYDSNFFMRIVLQAAGMFL